jgi:hypothetical protein
VEEKQGQPRSGELIAAGLTVAGAGFTLVTLVTAFRWVFG